MPQANAYHHQGGDDKRGHHIGHRAVRQAHTYAVNQGVAGDDQCIEQGIALAFAQALLVGQQSKNAATHHQNADDFVAIQTFMQKQPAAHQYQQRRCATHQRIGNAKVAMLIGIGQ